MQQLYDTGMYKKALRATDTIMKKFPRHGGASVSVGAWCATAERGP